MREGGREVGRGEREEKKRKREGGREVGERDRGEKEEGGSEEEEKE